MRSIGDHAHACTTTASIQDILTKQRYVIAESCVDGIVIMRIPTFKSSHIHPCIVCCVAATANATVPTRGPPETGLNQPFFFVLPIALPKNVVQGPALHRVLPDVVEHPAIKLR